MKRILDILIIASLTFLLINLFSSPKEVKTDGNIIIKASENAYSIPASVKLNIINNSVEPLAFNTCNDMTVKLSGKLLDFSQDFCKDVEVIAGAKYTLDFSDQYTKFENVGNYLVEVKSGEQEFITTFETEHRGTITKIFVALFYAPIYNLVIFLVKLFGGTLGWAIIATTVLIKTLLIYPQHKMMVSQRKLQAIQPKLKKIQEEFKGDRQMLGVKTMELYKKEKVNPLGSCGFLLIQMPILIVIYNIILTIQDPSNFYHIYDFLSNYSLDHLKFDFFGLDLLSSKGIVGIVMGITVALIQFTQIKLSLIGKASPDTKGMVLEKKKGDSNYSQMMPDPEMMNKFMLYGMPLMVGIFTYTFIAGVGIYWGVSTLFMIFQQLVVNKIVKK